MDTHGACKFFCRQAAKMISSSASSEGLITGPWVLRMDIYRFIHRHSLYRFSNTLATLLGVWLGCVHGLVWALARHCMGYTVNGRATQELRVKFLFYIFVAKHFPHNFPLSASPICAYKACVKWLETSQYCTVLCQMTSLLQQCHQPADALRWTSSHILSILRCPERTLSANEWFSK